VSDRHAVIGPKTSDLRRCNRWRVVRRHGAGRATLVGSKAGH
jgi:hypothetical protein